MLVSLGAPALPRLRIRLHHLQWAGAIVPLAFLAGYTFLVLHMHEFFHRWYVFGIVLIVLGLMTSGFSAFLFRLLRRYDASIEALAIERGQLLDATEAEHRRIETLMEASPAGVVFADRRGMIFRANAEARRILGIPGGPANADTEIDPATTRLGVAADHLRRAVEYGERLPPEEVTVLGPDGEEMPVLVEAVPIREREGGTGAVLVVQDISIVAEQREARAALERYLIRDSIARDLHDDIIQSLYAVGLGLRAAGSSDEITKEAALHSATEELNTVIAELRGYIQQLSRRPGAQASETMLWARVKALLVASGDTRWFTDIDVDGQPIPPETARQLYLIIRELISNVHRHARARQATLRICVEEDRLRVEVIDDGVGFDRSCIRDEAVGIRSVEERFGDLGGTVFVASTPGEGTRVVGEVPIADGVPV